MKKAKLLVVLVLALVLSMSFAVPAFASEEEEETTAASTTLGLDSVVNPVVDLINSLLRPLLAIVIAVGSLFCVTLGIKYAKAEEPQEREKAKQHLKNAIIGFVIIFVLILALNVLKDPLINWVNANAGKTVIK